MSATYPETEQSVSAPLVGETAPVASSAVKEAAAIMFVDGSNSLPPDWPGLMAELTAFGGSVCQGWDIVCSYNLADLNRLLNGTPAIPEQTSVPFSGTGVDPVGGANFTVAGTVELDQPQLQFTATGQCQVTMAIAGGTYTITPDGGPAGKAQTIPTGNNLIAEVSLLAINGDGSSAQSPDGVVTFGPTSGHASIVLHFNTTDPAEISWRIDPTPPVGSMLAYVLTAVQSYFANDVKEIDYALTGVNPAPAPGQDTIQPSAFSIATHTTSDGTGVLSLFIAASASGTGLVPPVVQTALIAADHSATLIFSPSFILSGYIQPSYPQSACVGGQATYTLPVNQSVTISTGDFGGNWMQGQDLIEMDDVTLNFLNYPYSLSFSSSTTPSLTISNNFSEQQNYQALAWGGAKAGWMHDFSATATGTVTLAKTIPFSQCVTLGQKSLTIAFGISAGDYGVSVDPGHSDSCWSNSASDIVVNAVQTAVAPVLPSVSFNLGALNFFAATNLLFPGESVITFDTNAGLGVPHDFLLTGVLVLPQKAWTTSRSPDRGGRPSAEALAMHTRRRRA